MTTDRAPRRRHAAGASRILVGGLSVATTLGLTAHWGAAAERVELAEAATATPASAAPAQRVVIVRRIIREVPAAGAPVATSAITPPDPVRASAAPAPATATPPTSPAAVPSLPAAALAPPPVISAPAPASSSGGS